jgi:hypothetical protein
MSNDTSKPATHQPQRSPHLHLPPQQPSKEIKTVTIALQTPLLARRPILPPQLLSNKQAPIRRNPLDPRSSPAFSFQRDNLVHVQPAAVVHVLEVAVEACATEARVHGLELCKDGREEFLDGQGGQVCFGGELGEGGRGRGVGDVQPNAGD